MPIRIIMTQSVYIKVFWKDDQTSFVENIKRNSDFDYHYFADILTKQFTSKNNIEAVGVTLNGQAFSDLLDKAPPSFLEGIV